MTTEEKIDAILAKLEQKKEKEPWEKFQIIATVTTGLFTLILAGFNVWITTEVTNQQQAFANMVHHDEQLAGQREDKRREMDEYIQELAVLPQLTNLLKDSNPTVRNVATAVLQKLDSNENFRGHIFEVLVRRPIDNETPSRESVNEPTLSAAVEQFWVYLGQRGQDVWINRFFEIDNLPSKGSKIKATSNVYKRDNKPRLVAAPDEWNLGKKIGVLKRGTTVTIIETLTLEGNNYWALVQY